MAINSINKLVREIPMKKFINNMYLVYSSVTACRGNNA